MSEENVNQQKEVTTTPNAGTGTEAAELEAMFKGEEAPEGETVEQENARLRQQLENTKKGVSQFFSNKGRQEKEEAAKKKAEEDAKKTPTPNPSSDDVTELFLESKPEAALVKDDLETIAKAKYDGSIVKAWKNEAWLQEKAKALSADEVAKGKIKPPSSATGQAVDMAHIAKLDDEAQAKAIHDMSDKEYQKWKEFQKREASSKHGGMISLSPR